MERNKELAPFGRWCNPTVSASGEAPCPSRASSTRHCPRPSGFARLVRSPCASGRSRLRTAKNTSSWPVRPAARKPRKAPSSPTSSSTYPPLRPPQILSSPSNGGRRGAISNATTLRVSHARQAVLGACPAQHHHDLVAAAGNRTPRDGAAPLVGREVVVRNRGPRWSLIR